MARPGSAAGREEPDNDYDSNTPERFGSGVSHRSGTPGTGTGTGDAERDSNYGNYEDLDQDDEKTTREQTAPSERAHASRSGSAGAVQMQSVQAVPLRAEVSAVERLAVFKDLGDMNPDSMAQIARLLQEKELKRLGQSLGQRS